MTELKSLIAFLEKTLDDQARRWREVWFETGDERVEALAQDAIREIGAIQDAILVGHLQDALDA